MYIRLIYHDLLVCAHHTTRCDATDTLLTTGKGISSTNCDPTGCVVDIVLWKGAVVHVVDIQAVMID